MTPDELKDAAVAATLPDVFAAIYKAKHTGPVTIDFAQGTPQGVAFPNEPTRIKLEKR
jgi:hypothetical protein